MDLYCYDGKDSQFILFYLEWFCLYLIFLIKKKGEVKIIKKMKIFDFNAGRQKVNSAKLETKRVESKSTMEPGNMSIIKKKTFKIFLFI